jgi:hypothetical protein
MTRGRARGRAGMGKQPLVARIFLGLARPFCPELSENCSPDHPATGAGLAGAARPALAFPFRSPLCDMIGHGLVS